MTGFMFDTNVFNSIVDGRLPVERCAGKLLFATHVQRDELQRTKADQRRVALMSAFTSLAPNKLITESAACDVSNWDEAKWPASDGLFDKIRNRVTELDEQGKKKSTAENIARDSLIAETAIKNKIALVSDDRNLRTATIEFGGLSAAMSLKEFLAQ